MADEIPHGLRDTGMLATETGYVPDVPDSRDLKFAETLYQELARTGVHLQSNWLASPPGTYNQQNLSSCVANAVAMALRYGYRKLHDKANDNSFDPSRLYVWYWAKFLGAEDRRAGSGAEAVKMDVGCQIRNALKSIPKYGACPETEWPYPSQDVTLIGTEEPKKLPDNLAKAPSDKLIQQARKYCNVHFQYFRVTPAQDTTKNPPEDLSQAEQIRSCIAEGYPLVFAIKTWTKFIPIYTQYMDQSKDGDYFVKMPPADIGEWDGGHAMLIIGYHRDLRRPKTGDAAYDNDPANSRPGFFRVQNSWGDTLTNFWLPYAYFEKKHGGLPLVHDTWVVKIEGRLNAPDDKRSGWDQS